MKKEETDHALEFLLAFDGRVHWLEQGYRIRFEIRRIEASPPRPHGLSYSFTLRPEGRPRPGLRQCAWRPAQGRQPSWEEAGGRDHWHRGEGDEGRPYKFESADKLLADFFSEVRRILTERGISEEVVVPDEGS